MGRSLEAIVWDVDQVQSFSFKTTEDYLGEHNKDWGMSQVSQTSHQPQSWQKQGKNQEARHQKGTRKKNPENQLNLRQQLVNVHHRGQLG
jgi:hypothetical protein